MPAGGSNEGSAPLHSSPYGAATGDARDPEAAWQALRKAKRHGVGVAGVAAEAMAEIEAVLRSGDVVSLEFASARGHFLSVNDSQAVVAEPAGTAGSLAPGMTSRLVIELWDGEDRGGADTGYATARRPPIRVVRHPLTRLC
eukprot:COSAG05_NODE_1202_length_5536_cov_1.814420_4_plen_142_part_00